MSGSRIIVLFILLTLNSLLSAQIPLIEQKDIQLYHIYPGLNEDKPILPSPLKNEMGEEYVIAVSKDREYGIIPVTLRNDRDIVKDQLFIDSLDFPALYATGLHDTASFRNLQTIAGRKIHEINDLGQPDNLSKAGFLSKGEQILNILMQDNKTVSDMGLNHPLLAKPLFHVLNMMDEDMKLNRWNMAKHEWDHILYFCYNENRIRVQAYDTKGGQKSIFDDDIEGSFYIKLWRDLSAEEIEFLRSNYPDLTTLEFQELKAKLSFINFGDIHPQYIMRYGFYEGHTFWRADPIAIAFIFGLKSLEELHRSTQGNLFKLLIIHPEFPR